LQEVASYTCIHADVLTATSSTLMAFES